MPNQNFPFCNSSGASLFRFWSLLSIVFIIFVLCSFQLLPVCHQHTPHLKRCPGSSFGAIHQDAFSGSVSHWSFGSSVAFLFPPLGTMKFIPLCVCFSKWICSYVRPSFDVPNVSVHLVFLHSNTAQPIPVVALIHFYVPDICVGDVQTCISWWADAHYKKRCIFTHLGCEFSFCV